MKSKLEQAQQRISQLECQSQEFVDDLFNFKNLNNDNTNQSTNKIGADHQTNLLKSQIKKLKNETESGQKYSEELENQLQNGRIQIYKHSLEIGGMKAELERKGQLLEGSRGENERLVQLVERMVRETQKRGANVIMNDEKVRMQGLYDNLTGILGIVDFGAFENQNAEKEESLELGEKEKIEKLLRGQTEDLPKTILNFGPKEEIFLTEIMRQREINQQKEKFIQKAEQDLFKSREKTKSLLGSYSCTNVRSILLLREFVGYQ